MEWAKKWGTVIPVYSWHSLSKRAQNTKTAKASTLCVYYFALAAPSTMDWSHVQADYHSPKTTLHSPLHPPCWRLTLLYLHARWEQAWTCGVNVSKFYKFLWKHVFIVCLRSLELFILGVQANKLHFCNLELILNKTGYSHIMKNKKKIFIF